MWNDCPDHPDIRRAMLYGDPEAEIPVCPVCGAECDTIYVNDDGVAVGCSECVREVRAEEYEGRT